jgi:hypothetical protein
VKLCVSSSEEGGVVALLECYNRALGALVGLFEFKYCGDMWAGKSQAIWRASFFIQKTSYMSCIEPECFPQVIGEAFGEP